MKALMAKTGTYQKDGETKNQWTRVGVMMSNDNGEFLLLDPSVNLAGVLMQQRILDPQKAGKSVMVSIFDDNRNQGGQQSPQQTQQQNNDFDDPIPF